MASINGLPHAITAEECAEVDLMNRTPVETTGCISAQDCHMSPILINLDHGPWRLTSPEEGVWFDFDGDGLRTLAGWTAPGSQLAFLFVDLTGNGCADSGLELFGDSMVIDGIGTALNGFEALVSYDSDRDRWITPADVSFDRLRLWLDQDHDGICHSGEVMSLESAGVVGLDLNYHYDGRRDRHGNMFWLRSKAMMLVGNGQIVPKKIYDVFFSTAGSESH